ncbi:MAG: hypothetical protein ACREL7_03185 [Longimicrobiales bacterium]
MTYHDFETLVTSEWRHIPDRFKGGIDALVVERDARAHPRKKDIYTLGECLTETYISDFGGPDTTRSILVLYYGSFHRLARGDPQFDWEAEIWETLTHELQHHLESLAAEDELEDVDAAVEDNFRRVDGEAFDPLFYLGGISEGGGWYRVEDCWFYEADAPDDGRVTFDWEGRRYAVPVPDEQNAFLFVTVHGVEQAPEELCIVVRRQVSGVRALFGRAAASVGETEAEAERLPPASGTA